MIVFIVFVVLLIGNCEAHWHHKPTSSEFYIKIETIGTKARPVTCSKDCSFNFDIGNTLELTCGRGRVKWAADNYEFETLLGDGGRLQITPDEEDINLNLTCKGYNRHEKITVTLVVHDANQVNEVSVPGELVYLNIGDSWTSSDCYGILYYPIPSNTSKTQNDYYRVLWATHDTHKVITSFNETLNGTMFYCITFMEVTPSHPYELRSVTKKRVKIKFTFYLNRTEESTNRREDRQTESGIINDPQTKIAAIVGGVLGAIIFVLLTILLGIWYKTMRQRLHRPNDGATQVIYADIEEMLTAPPPPPRNPISYAKIVGTLMPKQQPQRTEYESSIRIPRQVKHDPHSVTCQVKNDPHSVTCQLKNDPYSVTCQAEDDTYSVIKSQVKDDPYQ